jgi:VIT1/CCC1 family predicted Fe2+/Mn2+ transporter
MTTDLRSGIGERGCGGTTLGLRLRQLRRGPGDVSREEAASRVSAYVHGNVLVMAALISLRPEDLDGPTGVLYVLGAGLSTFVAHMVSDAVGRRIREGSRTIRWTEIRREIRDTLPVGTAATVPAAILLVAWTGLADAEVVLVLALAVTCLRLALLGSAVEWFSGERSSGRLFLAGLGLAVVSAAVAVLKWQLTH